MYWKYYLLSKPNFETKIEIRESEIKDIKYCKKIDDEKFLIQIPNFIVIIKVIDNVYYLIIHKYELPSNYYSFNSKFDLVYAQTEKDEYYRNRNKYYIYLTKYSEIINNEKSYNMIEAKDDGLPQFINDAHFFYFCKDIVELY